LSKINNLAKPVWNIIKNPLKTLRRQKGVAKKLNPFSLIRRIGNLTPIPFWFAQGRRELRYRYRDWASSILFVLSKIFYRVEVRGLENFTYSPSTIIACGHKRDADIAVTIPRLYTFRWPSRMREMRLLYEATRDDFNERGFLVTYLPWLDWARPILARLSVARGMHDLQTCPVKLPDEQTVNQLLQETTRLEGKLTAVEAISDEWRKKLLGTEANNPKLTLMDAVLRAPYEVLTQYATPRMFKEPFASRIRERHHQTLMQQLHYITRIADKGGTLFILPEGKLSPDGRFCKMRAALTRVVQNSRADIRLLPVNVTYDFMDSEPRPKVIMIVGEEILSIKRYPKNELGNLVAKAIPSLVCVTMSGLGSRYLLEQVEQGETQVRYHQLRDEIWAELQRLRLLDVPYDTRLAIRQCFEERLERFVAYCQRKGGIFTDGVEDTAATLHRGDFWLTLDKPALLRQECQKPADHPVRYCYNELMSLLEARDLIVELPIVPDNVLEFNPKRGKYSAG